MSFPDRTGIVRLPIGVSSWSMVLKDIGAAINQCVRRERTGAVVFINSQSLKLSTFPVTRTG